MGRTLLRTRTPVLLVAICLLPEAGARAQTSFSADGGNWESEQQIEQALTRRGSVDFTEKPLFKVMQELGRQFDVQIALSAKKLEEASVSQETPLTKKIDNVTLESILRLVLKDLELDFVVSDEVLMITTPEDAESRLQTRIYPVLDLVTAPAMGGAEPARDYDSLIEVILATVRPDSWDDVGGPGSIGAVGNAGAIVIAQTRHVHRSIEGLLLGLRHAKTLQGLAPAEATRQRASSLPARGLDRPQTATRAPAWQLPQVHPADR